MKIMKKLKKESNLSLHGSMDRYDLSTTFHANCYTVKGGRCTVVNVTSSYIC